MLHYMCPVGAGSAGSTLAARLSEGEGTVLVLEAGPEESYQPEMEVPLAGGLLLNTPYVWPDTSIPGTNYCLGMKGKVGML